MWTLYDFLESGNGYKVRLTLRELGRPFIYREIPDTTPTTGPVISIIRRGESGSGIVFIIAASCG